MQTILDASSYHVAATRIVQDVFETMLGYPVESAPESYAERGVAVTAAIFFARLDRRHS